MVTSYRGARLTSSEFTRRRTVRLHVLQFYSMYRKLHVRTLTNTTAWIFHFSPPFPTRSTIVPSVVHYNRITRVQRSVYSKTRAWKIFVGVERYLRNSRVIWRRRRQQRGWWQYTTDMHRWYAYDLMRWRGAAKRREGNFAKRSTDLYT